MEQAYKKGTVFKIYKEINKLADIVSNYKVICKYGHRIGKHRFGNKDAILCDWCNSFVFKDKKVEFR